MPVIILSWYEDIGILERSEPAVSLGVSSVYVSVVPEDVHIIFSLRALWCVLWRVRVQHDRNQVRADADLV